MNALIDTGLLLDYLRGDPRAAAVLARCTQRALSAVTWLELMAACPQGLDVSTRGFLRSFEQLPIDAPAADEALRLARSHPGLPLARAMSWACARLSQRVYVTTAAEGLSPSEDDQVLVPYAHAAPSAGAGFSAAATAPARPA